MVVQLNCGLDCSASGDGLVTAVECLACLAGKVVDGADGGFEPITCHGGFDIIQPAGNLVSQGEEGCIERVNLLRVPSR